MSRAHLVAQAIGVGDIGRRHRRQYYLSGNIKHGRAARRRTKWPRGSFLPNYRAAFKLGRPFRMAQSWERIKWHCLGT